jgi:pSer/pThr/pTyr-binding forkhead associated (FHA) protein
MIDPGLVLLALRLLAAGALYAFLAAILISISRDLWQADRELENLPEAHLMPVSDETEQEAVPLQAVNLLGRAADNTVCLSHRSVSAYHARLSYQGGQWWLEDMGSRNGTAVNEIRLAEPLVVTYGDRLAFGQVSFLLNQGAG